MKMTNRQIISVVAYWYGNTFEQEIEHITDCDPQSPVTSEEYLEEVQDVPVEGLDSTMDDLIRVTLGDDIEDERLIAFAKDWIRTAINDGDMLYEEWAEGIMRDYQGQDDDSVVDLNEFLSLSGIADENATHEYKSYAKDWIKAAMYDCSSEWRWGINMSYEDDKESE